MTKLAWFKKKPIPKWEEGPEASYLNLGIISIEILLDREATRERGRQVWRVFVAGQKIFKDYTSRGLAKYHSMNHAIGAMQSAINRASIIAKNIKQEGCLRESEEVPSEAWSPSIIQASVEDYLSKG